MPFVKSLLGRAGLGLAVAGGIYAVLIGSLLTPTLQRFALYAHKINTAAWDDLDEPETFGFSKHQVTPFHIHTPDGHTLYAWHVLPLDVYARNEKTLRAEERPRGLVEDFTDTNAFRLLTSDTPSPARVVVSFHGNAGHIAQNWRKDTYRDLATRANTHVLAIDYRGFGHSTGSPTEAGLITDGTALLDWVLDVAGIPPERIVILGQSLGTAVSSAVALQFADPANELIPAGCRELRPLPSSKSEHSVTIFAGIVLVAPFSSVPSLLLTYRIGGLLPILLPFRPFPYLAGLLTSRVLDKWLSAERLAAYYSTLTENPLLKLRGDGRNMGTLQLIHAVNDLDITYHQTEMICQKMFGEGYNPEAYDEANGPVKCIDGRHGPAILDLKQKGKPRVRFEFVGHGGHNRLVTYSPVAVAVTRALDDIFD